MMLTVNLSADETTTQKSSDAFAFRACQRLRRPVESGPAQNGPLEIGAIEPLLFQVGGCQRPHRQARTGPDGRPHTVSLD